MPWIAFEPVSRADRLGSIREWRRAAEAGGDRVVGIFDHEARVVGGAGLHRRSTPDVLDLGYWIRASRTGHGYATEAARALTTAAFAEPGIEAVDTHHDKSNVASSAVPRRLGFELIAESPDRITAPAECGIDCHWRMSRAAWHRRNGRSAEQ
jgi:RimJ/RimL family protein N-acetyltransferase